MAYGPGERAVEGAGRTEGEAPGRAVVVVLTRNNSRTIEACLRSLRAQDHPCRVVVVDNHLSDDTVEIARLLADAVVTAGPERSAQRNLGARLEPLGDVVGFVDSDMRCSPGVVGEAVAAIDAGAVAVIVPERTVGEGYWARVRAFERSFYVGSDGVKAARFYRRDCFEAIGGFDETLDPGPEDWDLSLRTRPLGPLTRVDALIDHDEGRVRCLDACRKKARYAEGLRRFVAKHGRAGALDRPYLRHPRVLASRLGAGVVALKAGEACALHGTSMDRRGLRSARPGATVAAGSDT